MQRTEVNLVWFKRDLRLSDHEPLKAASQSDLPALLLYVIEPMLQQDPHYSLRHWRFIWQSLTDMQQQLGEHNELVVAKGEMPDLLSELNQTFRIKQIFSHQEIGLANTFERDRRVAVWCRQNDVNWREFPCERLHGKTSQIGSHP